MTTAKKTIVESSRREQLVDLAGNNRGALLSLDTFANWNHDSRETELVLRCTDPVQGRANNLKRLAMERGLRAEAFEGTIEAQIASGSVNGHPLFLNLDDATTIANVLLASEHINSPILGYLLVKFPSTGALRGVRFFVRPQDLEARRLGVKFFHRLGELTARRGSAAIIGEQADMGHLALEPRIRSWFAQHTRENLTKLLAGIEPAGAPFEVTEDGETTFALLIHESEKWRDPRELAASVAANPPVAILRGESFVIGEVTPEGVRLHTVRRRKSDDRVTLHGLGVMDNVSVDIERAAREAAEAIARAARETLSKSNPVLTTD